MSFIDDLVEAVRDAFSGNSSEPSSRDRPVSREDRFPGGGAPTTSPRPPTRPAMSRIPGQGEDNDNDKPTPVAEPEPAPEPEPEVVEDPATTIVAQVPEPPSYSYTPPPPPKPDPVYKGRRVAPPAGATEAAAMEAGSRGRKSTIGTTPVGLLREPETRRRSLMGLIR